LAMRTQARHSERAGPQRCLLASPVGL